MAAASEVCLVVISQDTCVTSSCLFWNLPDGEASFRSLDGQRRRLRGLWEQLRRHVADAVPRRCPMVHLSEAVHLLFLLTNLRR